MLQSPVSNIWNADMIHNNRASEFISEEIAEYLHSKGIALSKKWVGIIQNVMVKLEN